MHKKGAGSFYVYTAYWYCFTIKTLIDLHTYILTYLLTVLTDINLHDALFVISACIVHRLSNVKTSDWEQTEINDK